MEIRRILVPIDFDDPSQHAFEYARKLREVLGADLEVLHVWNRPTYVPATVAVDLVRAKDQRAIDLLAEDQAREQAKKFQKETRFEGEVHQVQGNPADVISDRAESSDLTIVGTHGRSAVANFFMGSVAEQVVRRAKGVMLTVPKGADIQVPPQKVLVPMDFSDPSRRAYERALWLSSKFDCEILVLHVVERVAALQGGEILAAALGSNEPESYYRYAVRDATETLEKMLEPPEQVSIEVDLGHPVDRIRAHAEQWSADLIVMGTRGRSGLASLGSVAERTPRGGRCPVMIVH